MKTPIIILSGLLLISLAVNVILFNKVYEYEVQLENFNNNVSLKIKGLEDLSAGTAKADSYKNGTYSIDNQAITLHDGLALAPAAADGSALVMTSYFGNEVWHDFDRDGRDDIAFLLTQSTGGSGTFYYVVAALNTPEGYVGSDAYFLGDRIAPQTTHMSLEPEQTDVIVVNYADRAKDESFADQPSVGRSVYLQLDTNNMQLSEIQN